MIRLRELRDQFGYSVREMCAKLGVDDSRYRKWESGTNGLPLDYSLACCEIFHCTLDELAGRVPLSMTTDERELLTYYRRCNEKGRQYILGVASITALSFPEEE